jgi:hypothetical protein
MAAAWSAGASRMKLATMEDGNKLDSLSFMDFRGLFNSDFWVLAQSKKK